MKYVKTPWVTVNDVNSITKVFVDSAEHNIIVEEGIYDFSGATLVVAGDRHIKLLGDVVFRNVTIDTKCADDGTFYAEYPITTCKWDTVDSFDRTGGVGAWTATTAWKLFVRDAWYDINALLSGTEIDPVQSPHASGLTNDQWYVLVLPTENLYMEGNLTIDTMAGHWSLYGLANSDLSNLNLIIRNESSTYSLNFIMCATTFFPSIRWEHSDTNASANERWLIDFENVLQCTAKEIYIGNVESDDATAFDLVGVGVYYCQDFRLENVVISGLNRSAGTGDATGIYFDHCNSCYVQGQTTSIASTGGVAKAYTNTNGDGNNVFDLISR